MAKLNAPAQTRFLHLLPILGTQIPHPLEAPLLSQDLGLVIHHFLLQVILILYQVKIGVTICFAGLAKTCVQVGVYVAMEISVVSLKGMCRD